MVMTEDDNLSMQVRISSPLFPFFSSAKRQDFLPPFPRSSRNVSLFPRRKHEMESPQHPHPFSVLFLLLPLFLSATRPSFFFSSPPIRLPTAPARRKSKEDPDPSIFTKAPLLFPYAADLFLFFCGDVEITLFPVDRREALLRFVPSSFLLRWSRSPPLPPLGARTVSFLRKGQGQENVADCRPLPPSPFLSQAQSPIPLSSRASRSAPSFFL